MGLKDTSKLVPVLVNKGDPDWYKKFSKEDIEDMEATLAKGDLTSLPIVRQEQMVHIIQQMRMLADGEHPHLHVDEAAKSLFRFMLGDFDYFI